jgi:predicted RNA-binding Zn-ribbon protein involved in translation (DUF1610 family)
MVEPGRSAAKKTTTSTSTTRKKKLAATAAATKPDSEKLPDGKKQSSHGSAAGAEPAAAESPSYRLALRSLFSCRNTHAARHHRGTAPPPPPPAEDAPTAARNYKKNKQSLGCSSASICKLRDASPRQVMLHRPEYATPAAEPCKRRASVSGGGGSERRVKKSLQQQSEATVVGSSSRHWGSTTSSSSSTAGGGGSSFRLRRLSGCYECHMVVDPVSGSMRAAIFSCPDCGDVFVRAESLHLHQSTRHAGTVIH